MPRPFRSSERRDERAAVGIAYRFPDASSDPFAVPSTVFFEELAGRREPGREGRALGETLVTCGEHLAMQYLMPSWNDFFALVVMVDESCPLLTGDADLKTAMETENVVAREAL